MKYDDASWHYGGDFPKDLDDMAGATHIGMFVAWCLLNGLGGALHTEEFPEDLHGLDRLQGAARGTGSTGRLRGLVCGGSGDALTPGAGAASCFPRWPLG
jgi:hypothetical protein